MSKSHRVFLSSLCVAASMIGGAVVSLLLPREKEAVAATPAVQEEVIKANKIVMMDNKGRPRAVIGMTGDSPTIALFDEKSQGRVYMAIGPNGPTLTFIDANKTEVMGITAKNDGGAGIALTNNAGKAVAAFMTDKDGKAYLVGTKVVEK